MSGQHLSILLSFHTRWFLISTVNTQCCILGFNNILYSSPKYIHQAPSSIVISIYESRAHPLCVCPGMDASRRYTPISFVCVNFQSVLDNGHIETIANDAQESTGCCRRQSGKCIELNHQFPCSEAERVWRSGS